MHYKRTFKERLSRSLEGCKLKPEFKLCLFEEGFSFCLFGYFIPLPFLDHRAYAPHEIMESWGVGYFDRAIHMSWGRHYKFIHMPWEWGHLKCEVWKCSPPNNGEYRPTGNWVPYVGEYEKDKEPDGRWKGTYGYEYTLNSGEVQKREATIYMERREWRWRWFMWLPWPRRKEQYVEVSFDGEVGERTGSWKGGTIGCGYKMKPGETPLVTLRRMERERKF